MKRDLIIGLIAALVVFFLRMNRRQSWTATDWIVGIIALFVAVELAHKLPPRR